VRKQPRGAVGAITDGAVTPHPAWPDAETSHEAACEAARGPVTGRDLNAAEQRQGVTLEPDDALVLRGGWILKDDPPVPGVTMDALRWMRRRGVSLYAGDIGDARPPLSPGAPSPLGEAVFRRPWPRSAARAPDSPGATRRAESQ
jgi:hypothetical protein